MNETIAALLRSAIWTIGGNVGTEPQIRFLGSGTAVANFNIACNKPGAKKGDGQEPDWFKVEIWGDDAQAAVDTLRKGSRVAVTGRVRTERWTGKDGTERVTTVIRADSWSSPDGQAPATVSAADKPAATWQTKDDGGFNDAEVPF